MQLQTWMMMMLTATMITIYSNSRTALYKHTVSKRIRTFSSNLLWQNLEQSENIVQAENNKINKHVSGVLWKGQEQEPDPETRFQKDVIPSGQQTQLAVLAYGVARSYMESKNAALSGLQPPSQRENEAKKG